MIHFFINSAHFNRHLEIEKYFKAKIKNMRQSFFAVYINEMDSRNERRLDGADNILYRKTIWQINFDCEADQGESARRQEQFGIMTE